MPFPQLLLDLIQIDIGGLFNQCKKKLEWGSSSCKELIQHGRTHFTVHWGQEWRTASFTCPLFSANLSNIMPGLRDPFYNSQWHVEVDCNRSILHIEDLTLVNDAALEITRVMSSLAMPRRFLWHIGIHVCGGSKERHSQHSKLGHDQLCTEFGSQHVKISSKNLHHSLAMINAFPTYIISLPTEKKWGRKTCLTDGPLLNHQNRPYLEKNTLPPSVLQVAVNTKYHCQKSKMSMFPLPNLCLHTTLNRTQWPKHLWILFIGVFCSEFKSSSNSRTKIFNFGLHVC